MSKIQKIFEADTDDSESEYSQSSESECEVDEETCDLEDDDAEENLETEEVEDDTEEETEQETEDDEKEDNENEDNDDEEVNEEDDNESDEEENDDEENDDVDFDDFDEGEFDKENEVLDVEKADKTVIKKSKNFQNFMRVRMVQQRQKCMEHQNIREDGKKFLSKLFQGQAIDKVERLEKYLYNFCCRQNKENFKRCYSFELYSVMSNVKSKKSLNDIKDYYLEDVNHFERGTFEKEAIEDNKKLKLITHVSEPVAGIHKCRCGCDKVYSYELQTRSGDEGMTVFLQCYSCGRKWKL